MNLFTHLLVWLAIGILNAGVAHGEVYPSATGTWRRAAIIPVGQQVFSFGADYQRSDGRFASDGKVEPMGSKYSRSVNWKQLLDSEGRAGRQDLRQYMGKRGVTENDVAAYAKYSIQQDDVSFNANWAYGITSGWMIGLQMPLVHRTVRVKQTVDVSPALLAGAKSLPSLANGKIEPRIRELALKELENSGYDSIPDEKTSWEWGDVTLLSQELLLKTYKWTWSFQQLVRFPTAQSSSVSEYIHSSTDDGQVDVGATTLLDFRYGNWIFGMRSGAVAQLPDTVRVNVDHQDGSGSQVDRKVNRDLGDWFFGALDTEWKLTPKIGLNGEHSFLSKGRDHYNGAGVSDGNYENLSENSDQLLHQTRVGLSFQVGERLTRAGVNSQWVSSIDYTYPWLGRNSLEASHASISFTNYF